MSCSLIAPDGVHLVPPTHRFSVRMGGRRRYRDGSILFRGHSKYYQCPRCDRRTRVDWRALDFVPSRDPEPYGPPPSPFSEELRARFGQPDLGRHAFPFDFFCGACGAPVRLLFWNEERHMGGPWYPEVFWVMELDEVSLRGQEAVQLVPTPR